MEQPIGNQDSGSGTPAEHARAGGDANQPPQDVSGLPETEQDSGRKNTARCNCRNNKNRWNKFWDIAKACAELVLGIGLLTIAYWQYTVYTRQTGIMDRQANISEVANRQNTAVNRAFIVPSTTVEQSGKGDTLKWVIEAWIENSGNTPTRSLRGNFAGGIGPDIQPVQIPRGMDAERGYALSVGMMRAMEHHPPPIQAFLGPHGKTSFIRIELDQDRLQKIFNETDQAYLYGTVHYYDVFDDTPEHFTEFCYRVFVKQLIDGTLQPATMQCNSFNCADEECPRQRSEYLDRVTQAYRRAGKEVPPDFLAPIVSDPR